MSAPNRDYTKRFLLFTFAHYYPCGGMDDFAGSFDTREEAEEVGQKGDDSFNIFDTLAKEAFL